MNSLPINKNDHNSLSKGELQEGISNFPLQRILPVTSQLIIYSDYVHWPKLCVCSPRSYPGSI